MESTETATHLEQSSGCEICKTGAELSEFSISTGMSGIVLKGKGAGWRDHGEKGEVGRIQVEVRSMWHCPEGLAGMSHHLTLKSPRPY